MHRYNFDLSQTVSRQDLIHAARKQLDHGIQVELEMYQKLQELTHQLSQVMRRPPQVLNLPPSERQLEDLRLILEALSNEQRPADRPENLPIREWMLFAFGVGDSLAGEGPERVDALLANRHFVFNNAGFAICCGGGRMHRSEVWRRGTELYYAVLWYGRRFLKPHPHPDPDLVVSTARDFCDYGLHESIQQVPILSGTLDLMKRALWLGFLNRALLAPSGRLADLFRLCPQLADWDGAPYSVVDASSKPSGQRKRRRR